MDLKETKSYLLRKNGKMAQTKTYFKAIMKYFKNLLDLPNESADSAENSRVPVNGNR